MPSLTMLWEQHALKIKKLLVQVRALETMRSELKRPSSPQESIRSRLMPSDSVRRLKQQPQLKPRDLSAKHRPRQMPMLGLKLMLLRPSKLKKLRISDLLMKKLLQKQRQIKLLPIRQKNKKQRQTESLQRRKQRLIE